MTPWSASFSYITNAKQFHICVVPPVFLTVFFASCCAMFCIDHIMPVLRLMSLMELHLHVCPSSEMDSYNGQKRLEGLGFVSIIEYLCTQPSLCPCTLRESYRVSGKWVCACVALMKIFFFMPCNS